MKKSAENEEILIDADSGDEVELEEEEVANSSLKGKLKDLRTKLKETQKERDENLAGWQRAKADLANFRRIAEEDAARNGARAKGDVVKAVVPALDSFDSAMADSSWSDVDTKWREGVERIANQFHQALEKEGLTSFGAVGDAFDPEVHECMSVAPTDDKKQDHTIVQVLQRGHKLGTELIRPAKVVVAQLPEA
jgi:molecular chaperone GrpE